MLPLIDRDDFATVGRIVMGWGRRVEIADVARSRYRRALWVVGSRSLLAAGTFRSIQRLLESVGVESALVAQATREPTIDDVDAGVSTARSLGAGAGDVIIALGGGAALDLAKAIAALAPQTAQASVRDYLEGIGAGRRLDQDPLPWWALPTTAGTGSEATKNAVITSIDPPAKKSLRSDKLFASLVIVDPELTASCPPQVTAQSGMDAVVQLLESAVSRRARPIARALAFEGLRRAGPALPRAVHNPLDREARQGMAYAALLSGMALANSGLGMAHGLAAALGASAGIPHGWACALMLRSTVEFNRRGAEQELAEVARALLGQRFPDPCQAVDALLAWINNTLFSLGLSRRLRDFGVSPDHLPVLIKGSRGNSMDGNPVTPTDDDLRSILEQCL